MERVAVLLEVYRHHDIGAKQAHAGTYTELTPSTFLIALGTFKLRPLQGHFG